MFKPEQTTPYCCVTLYNISVLIEPSVRDNLVIWSNCLFWFKLIYTTPKNVRIHNTQLAKNVLNKMLKIEFSLHYVIN